MKAYKEFNKQIPDRDDHIVIAIPRGWIVGFVKANYNCELTEEQLDELSILVWEGNHISVENWIGETVEDILNGKT